ncbi:MAG TPA: glycosyltransferase family 39 protein [Candidatus Acidoferrum sp.]
MTETIAPITENSRTKTAARIGWAILILATLYVCYFSHLGAIGFVGPDEPRYAWIARDMAETGDWVTPRLYGKPWFEKPVLYYWGAALCFKLFGVTETAARLPSAISALLATLALAWLALRLYGAETARWLLLLLPTTVGMIGFSHAAATDMPFSGMLTIAMVCAAVVLGLTRNENSPVIPQTPWLALVLFGFFLGLAVLAKGPVGIILSGGAVFFWALVTKSWRDAFRLFHPAALASFCLTAFPWYILCARRNPDFFRIFIIEHNFKRYLTPEFQHLQPFWYYAPIVFVALIPWTGLALWSLVVGAKDIIRKKSLGYGIGYFLAWSTFCVLFFSMSKSKLPGYILPSLPPLALLVCRSWTSTQSRSSRIQAWTVIGFGLLLIATGPLLVHFNVAVRTGNALNVFELATWLGFISLPCLIFGTSGFLRPYPWMKTAAFLAASMVFTGLILRFTYDLLPVIDRENSPRYFAEAIQKTGLDLHEVQSYKLQRANQYALNYYLHRALSEWNGGNPRPSYVVTDELGYAHLLANGCKCKAIESFNFVHRRLRLIQMGNEVSADRPPHSGQPH